MSPIKVSYYQTNLGIFLQTRGMKNCLTISSYRVNGNPIPGNERSGFVHLEGVTDIEKVERLKPAQRVENGYILKDSVSEALRQSLKDFYSLEEVGRFSGGNGYYEFRNEEFGAVSSLYKITYDNVEETWEEIEFEHNVLGKLQIDKYDAPEKMLVKMINEDRWSDKKSVQLDLASIVSYSDIEKMLTPEFMLYSRPCSLSGDQVYKIVRAYVKDNIDDRYAQITSDYDFCFAVRRKISIKPIITRREKLKANGRSYATPRFIDNTVTHKMVGIFEMTPPSLSYKGYTPIKGWEAESLDDMKKQIRIYLEELMDVINTPVAECEHCGGTGHIVERLETNNRPF